MKTYLTVKLVHLKFDQISHTQTHLVSVQENQWMWRLLLSLMNELYY